MIGQLVFIVVLTIVLLMIGVFSFLIIVRERKEQANLPLLLNFYSNKSNKRFLGTITNSIIGKDNREIIYYNPKDLFENEKTEEQKIIVEPNKKIVLPPGTLSKSRSVVMVFPHSSDDFDESFRKSLFGKYVQFLTEMKNVEKDTIDFLKQGSKNKEQILHELEGGEISKKFMNRMNQLYMEAINTIVRGREEKKETYVGGTVSS